MSDPVQGPRIAIPGGAAEVVASALRRMATHCGEVELTITKRRLPNGGYTYVVTNLHPPARPVNQ